MRIPWYAPLPALALLCLALAAPAESADKVTVTGKVLLPDGSPAAGAWVGKCDLLNSGPAWIETQSATEGSFRLVEDAASVEEMPSVVAWKAGYAPGWVATHGSDEVTIHLGDKPATYHGRVCDLEGNPLPGATVQVDMMDWFGRRELGEGYLAGCGAFRASSDAQGRFALAGLPAGCDVILTVSAPGRADVIGNSHVGGPAAPFVLPSEASISGRVLREGQPVAGVTVRMDNVFVSPGAVTDARGAYRLGRLGTIPETLRIDDAPEGWVAAPRQAPSRHQGDAVTGLDFTFTRGVLLRGKVTNAVTAQALAGATVSVWWREPGWKPNTSYTMATYVAATAADGMYQIRVPAGFLQVHAEAERTPPWEGGGGRYVTLDAKEGETHQDVDFALTPSPPPLRGHVLRPDGTPAAGVEVKLLGRFPYLPYGHAFTAQSDANGAWQVLFPAEGAWESMWIDSQRRDEPQLVLAQEPATGLVAGAWVRKAQDDLQLTLAPGGYVVCHAADPHGQPVPDVTVESTLSVTGPEGPPILVGSAILPTVPTDAQGRARIGPLPAGYQMAVCLRSDQDYEVGRAWAGLKDFTLAAGEEHAVPALVIDREGQTVSGTVRDAHGRPAVGALVYAAMTPEAAETGPAGHFVLKRLPLSPNGMPTEALVAADPVRPWFGVVQLGAGQPGEVRLHLAPLGSATGQVVDEAGKPVAGVRVQTQSTASYNMPSELYMRLFDLGVNDRRDPTTDAEGKWKLEGLLTGEPYRLVFTVDGQRETTERTVTSVAGETVDLGKIVLKVPAGGPAPAG